MPNRNAKYFLVSIFILGFFGPFLHIPYNINDKEGVFGFTWMSSFLFAIGFPLFLISLSFLLYYASDFLPKGLKRVFRTFSILTAFTGFFFISWILNPFEENDYHPGIYFGAMIIISILLANGIRLYKSTLKFLIEDRYAMVDFLLSLRSDYKKMLKHALKPNLQNEAEAEVFKAIKKDSENFDKKLYEKGKELVE